MARKDVEKFLAEYAANTNNLKTNYGNDPKGTVSKYAGLTADEQEMLLRNDSHEIKSYLKDSYGAALSVNFP